jgi:8-oxo-dGTP diphosphatase
MTNLTPFRIGVALIIWYKDDVLMHLRKGSHGSDTWSFPGGHVDGIESPEEAIIRELKEETGIDDIELNDTLYNLGFVTNEFSFDKRYVTLYFGMISRVKYDAKVMEPSKCGGWKWFNKDHLPQPLFHPIDKMLAINSGKLPR